MGRLVLAVFASFNAIQTRNPPMKKLRLLVLPLVASVVMAAVPSSSPCPICDNPAGWTTKTKTENGRVFYEYRCVMGHTHWVLVK